MRATLTAMLITSLWAGAVEAQTNRADENVVTQADDGFGTIIGAERVGIYNPTNARGFSPIAAANVRIDGLFFDRQADLNERLIRAVNMRVGISAQSYPFPAPTGIADFSLRRPGDQAALSILAGYGPYGGGRVETDGSLPLTDRLSLGGGVGFNSEELPYGGDRDIVSGAAMLRWRPSDTIEVLPFWSDLKMTDLEAQRQYYTAGAYLPPDVRRRDFVGQKWAQIDVRHANFGMLANARSGGWTFSGGAFRSIDKNARWFADIVQNITPDGIGDRIIVAERGRRFESWSGELSARRSFTEGSRQHSLQLTLRGRDQSRASAAGARVNLGRGPIDIETPVAEPAFVFGPGRREDTNQKTIGLGYALNWRDVGQLTAGVQRSWYRKTATPPSGVQVTSRDDPWLYNIATALQVSDTLAFYGSYTTGLEESPFAPDAAVNRGEAPPATRTRQADFGIRWRPADGTTVIAGLFSITKPYFGLDAANRFGTLGDVRHRGVEMSVTSRPLPGLNVVAGAVLLDARVSGPEVAAGRVGRRPIGSMDTYFNGSAEYRPGWMGPFSVDVAVEATGNRIADRLNRYEVPPRAVLAVGGRYRFALAGNASTLRVQLANVGQKFGWAHVGEGYVYSPPRRLTLTLTTDFTRAK